MQGRHKPARYDSELTDLTARGAVLTRVRSFAPCKDRYFRAVSEVNYTRSVLLFNNFQTTTLPFHDHHLNPALLTYDARPAPGKERPRRELALGREEAAVLKRVNPGYIHKQKSLTRFVSDPGFRADFGDPLEESRLSRARTRRAAATKRTRARAETRGVKTGKARGPDV